MEKIILLFFLLLSQSIVFTQKTIIFDSLNFVHRDSSINVNTKHYFFFNQKLWNKKLVIKFENQVLYENVIEQLNTKHDETNLEDYKFISIDKGNLNCADTVFEIKENKKIIFILDTVKIEYNPLFSPLPVSPNTPDKNKNHDTYIMGDTVAFGKSIFYDVLYLTDKYIVKVTPHQKMDTLKNIYKINKSDLDSNSFLLWLKKTFPEQRNSNVSEQFNNILKTDVTNFATGMAQFLLERAKQELNESFFRKMYEQMNSLPELQHFFPESYYFLKQTNVNNIQINLEQLKSKFENDVRQFPVNLYATRNMDVSNSFKIIPKWNQFLDSTIPGKWIDIGLYTMFQSDWKINPKDLFYNFVHSDQRKELDSLLNTKLEIEKDEKQIINQLNLLNTIKLTELISSSLLSSEEERYWVTEEQLKQLLSDTLLFETYIGLLIAKSNFEDYDTIGFYDASGNKKTLAELWNPLYGKDYSAIKGILRDLYRSFNEVDQAVQRLKTEQATENLIDNSYKLYSVFRETIQTASTYIRYRGIFGKDNQFDVDQDILYKYITPCIDIAYHMKAKKYNLAINDALLLLKAVTEHKEKRKERKELNNSLAQFVKYGTLIANVATAESSEQVKAAIESSVLPVGSSRIKRHSCFSISLNAYVGGFYGQAYYKETIDNVTHNRSVGTFGVTAPIGLSFNAGNIGKKYKSALSLTAQVIDLGALVNFYYKNGEGASLPENTKIQLGDILAPGAQLSWSLGNCPVSAIAGFQYVPNLSRLPTIPTNNSFIPVTWRLQAGIVVDIPLFNLKVWTK